MAEYNMEHTGAELDEAVQAVLDGWRDVSPVTARASDVVWGRVIVTPEGPVTGTFQGVVPPESWRKTVSGATVTVSDGMAGWPLHSLAAEIRPVQDLHGYEYPWPAGGGKNLLKNELINGTNRGVTFALNGDGTVNISGTNDGTSYSTMAITSEFATVSGVEYILSGGVSNNIFIRNVTAAVSDWGSGCAFTGDGTAHRIEIRVLQRVSVPSNTVVKPMIRLASVSDATYAPYSNICPISASNSVTVTQNGESAASVTFPDEPGTVYGGAVDLKAGTLTVTGVILSGDGLPQTWTRNLQKEGKQRFYSNYVSLALEAYSDIADCKLICSHFRLPSVAVYDSAEGNSAWYTRSSGGASYRLHCVLPDRTIETGAAFRQWLIDNNVQFYLPLANPVVYQITIQEMPTLLPGENTFSADTGDVTVVYYSLPDDPVNPTVSVQSAAVTLTRPDLTLDAPEPEEDAIPEEEVSE